MVGTLTAGLLAQPATAQPDALPSILVSATWLAAHGPPALVVRLPRESTAVQAAELVTLLHRESLLTGRPAMLGPLEALLQHGQASAALRTLLTSGPLTSIALGDELSCQVAYRGDARFEICTRFDEPLHFGRQRRRPLLMVTCGPIRAPARHRGREVSPARRTRCSTCAACRMRRMVAVTLRPAPWFHARPTEQAPGCSGKRNACGTLGTGSRSTGLTKNSERGLPRTGHDLLDILEMERASPL